MLKKEDKVVDLQKQRKKREQPTGKRSSPLAAELNQALRGQDWLNNLRAAGL